MKQPHLPTLISFSTVFLLNTSKPCTTITGFSSTPSNRRRRPQPRISRTSNSNNDSKTGPKGIKTDRQRRASQRIATRLDKKQEVDFVPKLLAHSQLENKNAPAFSLFNIIDNDDDRLRLRPTNQGVVAITSSPSKDSYSESESSKTENDDNNQEQQRKGKKINHNHIEMYSLDNLFPNLHFSKLFYTDSQFREDIRHAMRQDIFDSTPSYNKLSPKIKAMMLQDSSLQGSWNCDNNKETPRMKLLTQALQRKLGTADDVPTGDEFMMALGKLCGHRPSTHWMDIIGVKDRVVTHSWHQDTGRSHHHAPPYNDEDNNQNEENSSCYTVMLGFPIEDEYDGMGVFSHAIKLTEEHWANSMYSGNEPVLFTGKIGEEHIIRPSFGLGREILRYRDIDVLHSAPDVIYRSSVMRFM